MIKFCNYLYSFLKLFSQIKIWIKAFCWTKVIKTIILLKNQQDQSYVLILCLKWLTLGNKQFFLFQIPWFLLIILSRISFISQSIDSIFYLCEYYKFQSRRLLEIFKIGRSTVSRNFIFLSFCQSCQLSLYFTYFCLFNSYFNLFNSCLEPISSIKLLFIIHYNFYITQQPYMAEKQKRPDFVNGVRVRMPEDYDFNTWGKDWSEYSKDYKLRTDAVWEKQQLKDWFRCTNKVFYFNKLNLQYQFIQPEDAYTLIYEPWGFQDQQIMKWQGFSPTGSTTCFQTGLGPKQKVENTFNSFYSMPDYYIMCAMRFDKWFRCDTVYGDDREKSFDRNPEVGLTNMKQHDHYPCFRQFYETRYACADNIFHFLIELSYHKKARGFLRQNVSNVEIRSFPTTFDSPNDPETVTYTY